MHHFVLLRKFSYYRVIGFTRSRATAEKRDSCETALGSVNFVQDAEISIWKVFRGKILIMISLVQSRHTYKN